MRLVIACDKFKGSLSAAEACEAVSQGLPQGWVVDLCPIADGGEGFVAAMLSDGGGELLTVACLDALGRPISADYGLRGSTAFIEMAAASGLWRIDPAERNLLRSSSFGTGQLIRHAVVESGATKLVVGIGGSATNDGGAGMAAALGVRFLDHAGRELSPTPESLARLVMIDESGRIALPEILVACDVDNPLTGPRGASAVFGPQKGAAGEQVALLDRILGRLVQVSQSPALADFPGAGAAGGAGFGLLRFAGARLVQGFDIVAEACGLPEKIAAADLVITGEGSLDSQTLGGKGPWGVARLARAAGKPVVAIAGRAEPAAAAGFDAVISLTDLDLPLNESIARAGDLVAQQVRAHAGLLRDLASR